VVPPKRLESAQVNRIDSNLIAPKRRQWFVDYLPVTRGNTVELLVDGENYARALYDALEGASSELLLTGLHFSPDFRLKRGPHKGVEGTALVDVLRSLAKARPALQIYLIVNQFWEDELTAEDPIRSKIVSTGSLNLYMPATLELFRGLAGLDNVHCRTDIHTGFVMSTHHQKTVVIDRTTCFVGGIDLTKVDGDRWDTNAHEIPDSSEGDIREYDKPEHFWHDVHCKLKGPAVDFVVDNFRARWNYGRLKKDVQLKVRYETRRSRDDEWIVPVRYTVSVPDAVPGRHWFADVKPKQCDTYQEITDASEGPTVFTRSVGPNATKNVRLLEKHWEEAGDTRVQVVRSMPFGHFKYGEQKPAWNLSGHEWERSTRDAYIVGIRAAQDYVYLENQWVSDEAIWEELKLSMRRNRDKSHFRIVVMLPRRPLSAAGFGRNQDVDLRGSVQAVIDECADATQFGMYSLVRKIPAPRQDKIALSDEDREQFGAAEAQIYIHSKILIVDDCWSLIGSANAGGISLLGVANPGRLFSGGSGSTPDSELSVIIHDKSFATKFRTTLWHEHLGADPGSPAAGADAFRAQAHAKSGKLRSAVVYRDVLSHEPHASQHRVAPSIVAAAREGARIEVVRAAPVIGQSELVSTGKGAVYELGRDRHAQTFVVTVMGLPPQYRPWFRWILVDERETRWEMRGAESDRVVHHYGDDASAYIGKKTTDALRARGAGAKSRVLCRVLIAPVGVAPRAVGEDDERYSFLLELPVLLV
jgi:phosphatidylserine/phosphatidylglycerophosphate/cardiolipin synthase-like enzyme